MEEEEEEYNCIPEDDSEKSKRVHVGDWIIICCEFRGCFIFLLNAVHGDAAHNVHLSIIVYANSATCSSDVREPHALHKPRCGIPTV